ncbi:GDP-fucose protein O-fucosyltransferase 1-like [Homarus americanus]|uniref:GDP-fucose protein O-fucosyltransferase 1 n=1 Tax=Homarus americanus TaxID=6706 RepID=A0A8J5NFE2_HOMAM|nr:GDP-fucose protein O-fucosyltransferase 1-like [Homarus americanus]KAG7177838.1 GDP-fucose protein O-fucosyltransferase 1-like [Homarus americanus]
MACVECTNTVKWAMFQLVIVLVVCASGFNVDVDDNGYVLFCPCMGRFGNQADHFLGALGFAKGLNRTLVLPPWVEYKPGVTRSVQIPFDTYFKVEPLAKYHRVMTMQQFMDQLAQTIWPPEKRIAFCYVPRHNSDGCNPKEGNPFGPFWDTFNIDFVGSEFYRGLSYDVHYQNMAEQWNKHYLAEKWPVLAFTGAPATFPVQESNRHLHKYLIWSDSIVEKAQQFIATLPRGPFIGIHLRNGIDWVRACEHVQHSPNLFAAPQCLGYRNEHGVASTELCLPSETNIIKKLKRVIKSTGAKSIFVASDNDFMIGRLTQALKKMKVAVHRREPSEPHVDLAILGRSNHFIANCVSSFSAFAKRERDAKGFPSSFWAFPLEKEKAVKHIEL